MAEAKIDRPELFVVDRTISIETAIIWMAATSAKQVKFNAIGQVKLVRSEIAGHQHYTFTGTIPRTADYLYGFRTSVPVKGLRLWLQRMDGDGSTIDLVDLTESNEKVKSVKFDSPIPLFFYYDVHFEYCFDSGTEIHIRFDMTTIYGDYKFLNPCFTLGLLSDEIRSDAMRNENICHTRPKITLPDDTERNLDHLSFFSVHSEI